MIVRSRQQHCVREWRTLALLLPLLAAPRVWAISGTCNLSPSQVAAVDWTATNGTILCGGTYAPHSLNIPAGVTVYELNGTSVIIEATTWIHIAGNLIADGAGGAGGYGASSGKQSGGSGGGSGGGPGGPGNTAALGGGGGGGGGGGFGCSGGYCGGTGGTGDGMNSNANGGLAYDTSNSFSTSQPTGSGGGGGGCTTVDGQSGGYGGNGGGSIVLLAAEIIIDSSAYITANGQTGYGGNGGGSGGGGSGGDILLWSPQVFSNSGYISVTGGPGAASTVNGLANGGGGGGGSGGRLKIAAPTTCSIGGSLNVAGAGGGAGSGFGITQATAGGDGLAGTYTCLFLSQYTTLAPTASPNPAAAGVATTIAANATNGQGYLLRYQYDCTGTGSGYGPLTSATTSTCTWTTLGTHTALVKATAYNSVTLYDGTLAGQDALFNVTPASVSVTVNDVPIVMVTAPTMAPAASPVTTLLGSISDPAGFSGYTWNWNYGDGTISNVSSSATTNTQSHTYAEPGTYTITLTVTDSHNSTGSNSTTIVIADVAPTVTIGPLPSPDNAQSSEAFTAGATSLEPLATSAGFAFTFAWGDSSANSVIPAAAGNGTGVTAHHAYPTPGMYVLTVSALDKFGGVGSEMETVTVGDPIPSVQLGAMSTTIPVGSPLLTTTYASSTWAAADAAGFTFTYAWGDGQTTTVTGNSPQTPSHVYESPGNYTVQVTVTDNTGVSGSATLSITVTEVAPTVVIGTPNPSPVIATSASAFPVMVSSVSTVATSTGFSYVFNWGDGTPNTMIPAAPANGSLSPSHTYAEPGSYTLTVTATDTFGGVSSASATLTVVDAPPTAAFGSASYSGPAASPVTFQATASSPVGSQESGDFTYTFTWGDGQKTIVSGGTSVSTTHTYDSGGSYTASLVVLDSLSTSSATVTTSVTISNVAPIITSFTHPNGSTGVATQFSVLVSDASNADTAAGFSIVWNFGDGSQPVTGANLNNTSHQFSTPGTYTVSVTATDQNGLQATASATIIIRDTPPSVSLGPTQSVAKNTPVTLTPTLNPDNPLWSYTYAWTLGDGTSASGPTVTESFASLGTYTVSVLVTDPFGGSGTGSVTINVVNQPPVVTNVLVSPANPLAQQQPLTLSYTYADPNGSPENGTTIVWYLNGEGDAAYNNKTTIPATALQRNQTWYAVVTPKDGIAFGAPVTSNTVTVGDPPPQALNVTLSPTNPKHADTLSLSYTYSSVYPEQGTTISWTRNGSVQPTLANQKSVPPPLTRGDTWMVTVTPSDGMTMGAPETTSVVIQDTAPVLAALPDLTRMATGLTTSVSWTVSATDIDGDTVAYDCATPQQDLGHGPAYSFAFPLGATTVTCTASDGTLTTTDTFQVHINDVLPTLALTPSETVDPGNVTLVATASDPFGRPLTYAWTVVSGPQGLTPRGSTNAAIFSFSAFTAGSYVLQCAVSNGTDQTLAQTTVTVAQLAPQVNLGASPRTLVVGETITLDGSHSVDPNGGTLTWKWAVASGPVTIAGSNSAITSLTASAGGQGVVSLTVDDGARSSTAQLVVNVWDNGSATAPVASAGPAQTVVPGSKVTLDASSSFDPNAQVLTWSWAQQSGPNVTLSDVTAENPTFVAPPSGTLSFVLTATDSAGASQSTVHVNVMGSDTEKIPTAVINPVDVTIAVGGTATLQNESLSPLALSLTPTWTWVGGPYVTLTPDAQARTCAVTAYGTGEAVIQLVVNDGVFDSAPALARVHVTEGVMAAPSATVPASLAGAAGTPIVLDGSSSADPNGLPLVAQWTQLSGPPVAIHGSETLKASFDPSAPGTYTFQLGLSDWIFDASATLTVNVSMEDVPVAVATGPATAYVGDSVALSGAQSHDPQGGALTFTWTQVSGPPATLDKAGTASPSFQPTTNGTYVFQLEVANGATTSAPATITIKVEHFPRLRGGCSEAAETGWLAALVLLGWIRRRTSR